MARPAIRLATAAALACLLLSPPLAQASGSGSFSPTGSMGTPRWGAFAAPLPDGRVLVGGGSNPTTGVLASAEIFNPQTNSFSSAGIGAMSTPRFAAAAAPLPDGRVLVAGGAHGGYLSSAEIFNPQTNTFSSAGIGPMMTARAYAIAAPLPDGRVLVAGGFNGAALASAEIFNPQTNTFSSAGIGAMGTARDAPAAAALPDGRVLVAGGSVPSGYAASAEVFSPQTNSFSSAGIGSMEIGRSDAAGAALPDGRVLVAGGYFADSDLNNHYLQEAEVFNPQTNSFSSAGIGALNVARDLPAAARLPDGRILVAGGYSDALGYLSSAEIFSATNAFTSSVKGKKLIVHVQSSGKVLVADASSPLRASESKKKRRILLKPSSGSGDPPTITVALRLTKFAKQKLRLKGKVTVNARITFTPQGGLAKTETAKLRIRSKKH